MVKILANADHIQFGNGGIINSINVPSAVLPVLTKIKQIRIEK